MIWHTVGARVRDVVTTEVHWLQEDDSLADVLAAMERRDIVQATPVRARDGQPKGLLVRRDWLVLGRHRERPATVGEGARAWRAVDYEDSLDDALRVLEAERIGWLPVVDNGEVVGVVTRAVIRELQERLAPWRPPTFADGCRKAGFDRTAGERPSGMPTIDSALDREIDKAIELLRSVPFEELQRRGWHFQPNHYYWPLNDIPFLREHPEVWMGRSVPAEIDWDMEGQFQLLESISPYLTELADVPAGLPSGVGEFVWNNPSFPRGDAYAYYGIVRKLKPRRLIEVGAGWSTLVMARAIAKNATSCEVTLVEPDPPWGVLGKLPAGWTLVEDLVQFVGTAMFEALEPGDVLFYDGSHCVRTGGDVNWIFFEVLPRLAPGVFIHVHDVAWPWDYPAEFILDEGLSWNEQYFVQAFLMGNRSYRVRLAVSMLPLLQRGEVSAHLPEGASGGSLWIEKLGAS
jgi:CBS domain-containing protein